jgi:hypothetical protein
VSTRPAIFFLVGAALVALALHGCGDDTHRTVVLLEIGGAGAPRYGEAPLPSEAWRRADGSMAPLEGLETAVPRDADFLAAHVARLDGAGMRPLVEFPLSGPLDPDTVPAHTSATGDAAVVIDVDPASPERGRVIPYEWRYDDEALVVRGAVVPGHVLRPGTLYAAILSTDVRDADGQPLAIAPALRVLLRGNAPAPWATTAAALGQVTADPIWQGGERIAGAAVFRTQRATRTLLAARDALDDPTQVAPAELTFPDPSLVFRGARLDDLMGDATRFDDGPRAGEERWGFSNPTGMAHDHVGVIATGRLSTTRFRRAEMDGDGPDSMTFELDPDTGAPLVQSIDSIPVTFVLPAAQPPTTAGYPVAIFGHGLGASRAAVVSFAEPLTRAGYAVVCVDFDQHGSRFDDIDRVNNLSRDLSDFTGVPDMPDGFGDRVGLTTTFATLGGLRNLSAARDAIQQNVLDLSQLVLFLRRGGHDLGALAGAYGGKTPSLDASSIAYLGESFGTIAGGVLAALEPEVDLFVLDVPGAAVIDLAIAGSPEMSSLLLPLLEVLYGVEGPIDRFHPLVALVQSLVDAVDPITWAPFVLREPLSIGDRQIGPRHLVALEVVGDEVIPNQATEAWAAVVGLEVLAPHMDLPDGMREVASPAAGNIGGRTGVLVHYAPATHGANWTSEWGQLRYQPDWPYDGEDRFPLRAEPLWIPNPIYQTLDQVVEILDTHRAGGAPVVRSTQTPSPP